MATKPVNDNERILKAIEHLYTDVFKTSNKLVDIELELHEIKLVLCSLIKRFQSLDDFEKKIFVDNLKKEV